MNLIPSKIAGELNFIDPILPGIDEDDFDEDDFEEDDFDKEEGEIDNDILQIEDKILREKLLIVNLLIDKIKALKLTPSIPFVLENPSSSPIPVVDSDFLVEEGEYIDVLKMLKMTILSHCHSDFSPFAPTLGVLLYFSLPGVETPFFDPDISLRAGCNSVGN
ncbi:hypothetical protein Tco_0772854 [Tanacetum coccineum]|uniref:Uncharacterized protein n=1 Tax=Tanacetum coccineum TaxID=301880 RepID=A0ABQ4ZN62_9ASTR